MAQTQYRANLSAKDFVYISQQWGRTVIVKQFDQNFSRQIVSAADPDKDIGIPQIWYCHNVMPGAQGFCSIGSDVIVPTIVTGFVDILFVRDATNQDFAYLGILPNVPTGHVTIYSYNPTVDTTWQLVTVLGYNEGKLTVATINGQSYLYNPRGGCYLYDVVARTLTSVTLTALNPFAITGICEAFGYMIAWDEVNVYWSSTIDPTDFTPSLITGSGGGGVQEARGNITFCKQQIFGFVIYTDKNAVAGVFSGNAQYPFNFRPITGCGGCFDINLVDVDSESGNQYAWTTSGFQLVSVNQASQVFPELTNFLAGSLFEDFDETVMDFVYTTIGTGTMNKRICMIASRYLVISYSDGTVPDFYTHALVYDCGMKRWGKLKFNHVAAFELFQLPSIEDHQPRKAVALLDPTGIITQINFDQQADNQHGIIILGKYQHTRNRTITLQEIAVENIVDPANFNIFIRPTYDGKTWIDAVTPTLFSAGDQHVYRSRVTGLNHSIVMQGRFSLDSIVLSYIPNGRR